MSNRLGSRVPVIGLVALTVCTASVGALLAQQPLPIRSGPRVRVSGAELPAGKVVGNLSRLDGDTLVVGRTRIPAQWVSRVEVSAGRRSHWLAGMGIGALVGATFGAIAEAAADPHCTNKSVCVPFAAAAFGVLGMPVGLLVGLFVRTDRWQDTTLDQLRIVPFSEESGRFGLTVSFRF